MAVGLELGLQGQKAWARWPNVGTLFAPGGENDVYAHLARDKSQNASHKLADPPPFAPGGENSVV
ncbi:hypothetical protein C2W62_03935 [Candidatus Entotheonella serta]|nr:hypothetical protein C2W62_03935 [Candidatus Entotheonella serta]